MKKLHLKIHRPNFFLGGLLLMSFVYMYYFILNPTLNSHLGDASINNFNDSLLFLLFGIMLFLVLPLGFLLLILSFSPKRKIVRYLFGSFILYIVIGIIIDVIYSMFNKMGFPSYLSTSEILGEQIFTIFTWPIELLLAMQAFIQTIIGLK